MCRGTGTGALAGTCARVGGRAFGDVGVEHEKENGAQVKTALRPLMRRRRRRRIGDLVVAGHIASQGHCLDCSSVLRPGHCLVIRGGGGAGQSRPGSGTQKFVYQKGPDKIFPIVNFVFFPTMVTLVWGGGGKQRPDATCEGKNG